LWVAARYVVATKALSEADGEENWRLLREFCNDLVALRKGDHSQERLKVERERLGQLERELELKRESKVETFVDELLRETHRHPRVKAATDALAEALAEAGFK
jgi:hypothetical protein